MAAVPLIGGNVTEIITVTSVNANEKADSGDMNIVFAVVGEGQDSLAVAAT